MAAPALQVDDRAATVARICERIANGELVAAACDGERIHHATLRRWLAQDATLAAQYTHARSVAADALAEEAVRIAVYGEGEAQDRRLAYDALRWLAGKRRPHEYGDKQTIEHTGTVGHLHLDALRATSRNARSGNVLRAADNVTPLPATSLQHDDSDAPPIETTGIYPGWGDPISPPSSE